MRTPGQWLTYRLQRIPRKLGFASNRLGWLYRDVRNGLRIWWELGLLKRPLTDLTRYERRIDSQHGEDGILEAILSVIGTPTRYFVELGSGDATECNTLYLSRWKGWNGLWIDSTYVDRQGRVKREHVTAENVEAIFARYGVPRTFDLLSIDLDGNDYWVWKALLSYEPRVVIIEYNANLPPHERKTIPYDPAFRWDGITSYYGASLSALQILGSEKGYCLVGCDSSGTNAVFVKEALAHQGKILPSDVASAYRPPTCFDGQGDSPDPLRPLIEV